MRSLTMFAALLIATGVVLGQTGATSLPPTGPKPQTTPAWECVPNFYGKQVGDTYRVRTNEGRFIHWYCQDDAGALRQPYIACLHGSCLPVGSFFEKLDEIDRSVDKVAAIKSAAVSVLANDPCVAPAGNFVKLCADLRASQAVNRPAVAAPPAPPASAPAPTYTHVVKANGTALDRPAYLLNNGVRGTTSVGRATVGQPCDLAKPPTLASGSDVWASYGPLFEAGRVALCTPK